MLLSLLHGLRGTHGSGDPGQCPCLGLGGPAQVGGSGVGVGVGVGLCGGSQALPPSVPCLRLPLGLRDLAKPLDFLPGLGRVFHQEPCQQPRDVRAPCSPWPQATSCLLLLGAPWLPWGPPSRKHGALPQAGGGAHFPCRAAQAHGPQRGLSWAFPVDRAASCMLPAQRDPPSRPWVAGRGPGAWCSGWGSLLSSGPHLSHTRHPTGPSPRPCHPSPTHPSPPPWFWSPTSAPCPCSPAPRRACPQSAVG